MKIILLLAIFLAASCQLKLKGVPEPENLISEDKMALIIEELMIVENQVQTNMPHVTQFQESIKESGDIILKKYKVTYKEFKISTQYYGSQQEKMKGIYTAVMESMNKKLTKLQAK